MLRIIVQLGNSHFVFRRGRSTTGSTVDRPLLNTKWVLPNSTIVLSVWFTIRSNSFTVWDISFILQKLLHSNMIHFPLNSGVSSLNLHELVHGPEAKFSEIGTTRRDKGSYVFFDRSMYVDDEMG